MLTNRHFDFELRCAPDPIGSDSADRRKPAVFVLGASGCNGLGVVRCFGRRGIPVYLFDESRSLPHANSRYCTFVGSPSFELSKPAAAALIAGYAERLHEAPVVIPTSDRTALYETKYRPLIGARARFISSEYATTERLIRKDHFYSAAEEAGVPYPKTLVPTSLTEARHACAEVRYPAIIKPALSADFVRAFGAKSFTVNTEHELCLVWERISSLGCPVVVQEFLEGQKIVMWYGYYNRTSELVAYCGYHKRRQYPPEAGSGSLVEFADTPKLVKSADRLLQHIGYHGIVEPEFKFDIRTGEWKILEINARTSTQNRLPAVLGEDMEYLAYCEAVGLAPVPGPPPRRERRYLWTETDFDIASAILDPGVNYAKFRKSRSGRKIYANFAWDDPLPGIVLLGRASRTVVSALLRRYLPSVYVLLKRKRSGQNLASDPTFS